uniref:(northern house mosquito) hypothetical protein n=1 Tax=Culex pipiens TaxID=7175 RepID=A0A8D8GYG4_CULPI
MWPGVYARQRFRNLRRPMRTNLPRCLCQSVRCRSRFVDGRRRSPLVLRPMPSRKQAKVGEQAAPTGFAATTGGDLGRDFQAAVQLAAVKGAAGLPSLAGHCGRQLERQIHRQVSETAHHRSRVPAGPAAASRVRVLL